MNIPRIMIAAPSSGSGKTLISCGLLGALKNKGINIKAFKCGPDYIDPMFLKTVAGVPAENIDLYLAGKEKMTKLFIEASKDTELALIEGVMGLYDGLGGISSKGSAYDIARTSKTPVIMVVDAQKTGFSIAALIRGFLSYDEDELIKGVILNRISRGFYEKIKPVIENETGLKVLGRFSKNEKLGFDSRYLGLMLPGEVFDVKNKLKAAALQAEDEIDIEAVIGIAKSAEEIDETKICTDDIFEGYNGLTLAVARDEAFCFYYDANIRMFEKAGINIKYFSPLRDSKLPENADGILIGGGYPELYTDELEANITMRESIKKALDDKIPSLAECGGFMYLHKEIDGKKMVGAIDARAVKKDRLVRFGYKEIKGDSGMFLKKGAVIRAHEFHYYDSTDNGDSCVAVKALTKESERCMHEAPEHFWGFPHLYYPSAPCFIRRFMDEMKKYHISEVD